MKSNNASAELILPAYAKLNLFLKIIAKRADGFHDIETVMQSINLHDTLRFRPRSTPDIRLRVVSARPTSTPHDTAQPIPTDESNLVVKAARLLQSTTRTQLGADILLVKRIPSAAGLGGGSADAGATFWGLNQLWNLRLNTSQLGELAAQLGSDIPFFTARTSLALCSGRGEIVEPMRGKRLHFVLVKPRSGLSTPQVYSKCTVSTFCQSGKELRNALYAANISRLKFIMENGLEPPARQLSGPVDDVLSDMQRMPFVASLLSGSGSTCYGVCRSARQARVLAGRMSGRHDAELFVTSSRV